MSTQPESDLFPICSKETNPTPRRGAPPGNTNALRHGLYSERFNPRQLHSLLTHEVSDGGEAASGSDQYLAGKVNLDTPLTQHLNILQAVIQDLAQTAADGEGSAVPPLLQAIRIHTTLATLTNYIQNPPSYRRRVNPYATSKCFECGDWHQNMYLSPEGLCRKCSQE